MSSLEEGGELGFDPIITRKDFPYHARSIRFTQDSINSCFRDGKSLQLTLHFLRTGEISLEDIPNIKVFVQDRKVYSLDNRRLWLLKNLDPNREIRVDVVQYDERFASKITTTSDGAKIHVRTFAGNELNSDTEEDSRDASMAFKTKVLSWTKDQIMNEVGKLPLLPQIFESVAQYLSGFKPHVIEEVRAQLKRSIETMYEAPRAELKIQNIFQAKERGLLEVHAAVFRPQPEDLDVGKANDVLFLTERPDGEIVNRAVSVHHEISGTPIVKFNVLYFDHKVGDRLFAYWCGNITTPIRINYILRSPRDLKRYLAQLISPHMEHFQDNPTQTAIPLKLNQYIKDRFNLSQQQAIRSITAAPDKDYGKGILLLQGPPGTGKTATIIGSLSVLVARGTKVLVCSSSNHAVDDIARKVANNGLKNADGDVFHPFVILVGNEENINLTGGLEKIFLANVVKNMHQVKGKLIATTAKIQSFFAAPHDAYEQYLRAESKEPQKNQKTKKDVPVVLDFISKAINSWVSELILWLPDAQAGLLPTAYQQYKPIIEGAIVSSLKKLIPVLSSLSSDLTGPDTLAQYLKNGLPAAISKNAPLGIRTFYALWQEVMQGLSDLTKKDQKLFTNLEDAVMQEASVVFSTVSTCGSFTMRKLQFEIGIVDEAAQCIEAETLLALGIITNRCVLVGDPQQLPSTVISRDAQRLHYGRSMMARMMECKHPSLLLNVQYRMHPDISIFPNMKFYHGKIHDGETVRQKEHGGKWHEHPLFPTYAFFDIKGIEERDLYSRSLFNTHEVNAIGHIISNLLRSYPDTSHTSIGVITPYSFQRKKILEQLATLFPGRTFEVNTVDGFQGREMDIIIFSAVRANWTNDLGFVRDYHRLNVAITRAKYSLWIVGHCETLGNETLWKSLIQDAKNRGRLFGPAEHNISVDAKVAVQLAMTAVENTTTKRRPIFEDAPWQVILSNRACETIREIMQSQQHDTAKRLFERLLWLAMGNRPSNYALSCSSSEFLRDLLFEYRLKSGQTILWTVDIDRYQKKQIFKVWDVLRTPDRLLAAVRRIERALRSFSQPYINLCKMQLEEDGLILPLLFKPEDLAAIPTHAEVRQNDKSGAVVVVVQAEKAAVEESFLLMKFFPLSSHLARMLAVGNDIEIPFQLSPEETELVKFPMASLFILGRSGTGKTTVLVFRMFSIQQAYQNSALADIANHMSNLEVDSVQERDKTEKEKKYEQKEENKINFIKQLFVTASPKLCASIKDYYRKLHVAIKPDNTLNKDANPDDDMMDEDEEEEILADVPDSLSLVTEANCPLILTFTKLLSMIDLSFPSPFLKDRDTTSLWSAEGGNFGSVKKEGDTMHFLTIKDDAPKSKRKEVDFPRFSELYYKHFDQRMTAVVDVATVFLQIMSFIKGSAEAMLTPKGYLSEAAYLSYPPKKCPLAASKREVVYKMFEKYENMKAEKNDYDQCDYIFYVIKQLRNNEVLTVAVLPKINFVYIDEVQDLTQAQLLVFRYICDNLKGFVFAGDTAQTIARGVGFRFEDIRSLYYTEFAKGKEVVPELHHLTQNFRTHSGICNIASSIVEPLLHFFPESIDKLKRETALVAGDCPIFLEIQGFKEIFFHMFREGTKVRVEFGAEQAIIVRDQVAKEKLLSEIDSGLVLTIYEAKGLEFKSVLLFNFWKDSPAKNVWRVLYQFMAEKKIGTPENYPEFTSERFSALCNELKQLYVGVTRTRQDLFIFDEDDKTHQPMLDYWTALGYINRVSTMDHQAIANLAQKSEPEKWLSEGKKYFQNRNYELALQCFINSRSEYFQLWTKASILKVEGKKLQSMDKNEEALNKFHQSAELYLKAHVHPEKESDKKLNMFAANLFIRCREFTKAGEIFLAEADYLKAGECFKAAKKFDKAATCFAKANMLPAALECCLAGNEFELGRDIISRYHTRNAITLADEKVYNFLRTGALHFHNAQNPEKTLQFVHMFEPTSHRRKFLERYGYVEELVKVELAEGHFSKAGDIYMSHGKYEDASNSYIAGKEMAKAAACLIKQATSLEVSHLMANMRRLNANSTAWVPKNKNAPPTNTKNSNSQTQTNAITPQQMKPILEFLTRAKSLAEADPASTTAFEIDLMVAIKTNDFQKLESLLPIARNNNNTTHELNILFYLLPTHIANPLLPISQLLEEGQRMTKLGFEILNVLSAAELNRPFLASKMQQVEDFFQVQPHPNPEMKVVQRIDWLNKEDYKPSVARIGQLEVRRDVFLVRAIAFLGRSIVTNLIGIVGRFAQLSTSATNQDDKLRAIFEAIGWGKDTVNIFAMTHLHFSVTLQDLRLQFEQTLEGYLRYFTAIFYPATRMLRAPSYLYVKRGLRSTPAGSQNLMDLCYMVLFSPNLRFLDGLYLSLLADLGHNLNVNIYNYQFQLPLIEFLLNREAGQLFKCSISGVQYLNGIIRNNWFNGPGLPPSQAVWMLENLVVYNLAYCTNFHGLILPKSLAMDCMIGRESLLSKCLFPKKRRGNYNNQRDYLDMREIWDIITQILAGKLYGWLQVFPYEQEIRFPLIERLLHLMFVIRLNTFREFSMDLADFLRGFRNSQILYDFGITLSPQWQNVMHSQIKNFNNIRSCTDFLAMMRGMGEPYVMLIRGNTFKWPQWAYGMPQVNILPKDQPLNFSVIENTMAVDTKQPAQPAPETTPGQEEATPDQEENTQQEEVQEGIEVEEEKEEDNALMKEAKYFNNMKVSLKYKMLRWLRRVRRRMYNLSPHEKHQLEARNFFNHKDGVDQQYVDFYCENVCSLREQLVAAYESLNTTMANLKALNLTGSEVEILLDKGLDAVEDTQEALEVLDIKHPQHENFAVEWIQEKVDAGFHIIERIQELETSMQNLGLDTN